MKILIIGGSYFFGRWFLQLAHKDHEITVANRGNIKVGLPGVKEYIIDRHNKADFEKLSQEKFDYVVDFCAYQKGDIQTVVDAIGTQIRHYVFISTVDVYQRGTGMILNEDSPFEERQFPGPEGEYITGKVLLEKELVSACSEVGILHTSVRPVILYGPANYAPREKMFFDWINQASQILVPENADGHFQMLYVLDAAKMLLKILEKGIENGVNLIPQRIDSYKSFVEALKGAVDIEFEVIETSKEIPFPFPVMREESEEYESQYELLDQNDFTPLAVGLRKCQI